MQICNLGDIIATLLMFQLLICLLLIFLLLICLLIFLAYSDGSDNNDWGHFPLVFWISICAESWVFTVVEFSLVDLPENLEKPYQKLLSIFQGGENGKRG
jgi:hypothetical protein